jgi:hypothetical protein
MTDEQYIKAILWLYVLGISGFVLFSMVVSAL